MELEKSRESAARLLDALARKLRTTPGGRRAADGLERAANYVHIHSVRDVAFRVERFVNEKPATAILIAVAAGFLAGRALRPRAPEEWYGES
jgi:ElaB/YqjD/DUF883 family membrane-anchored ribosome-binding protein